MAFRSWSFHLGRLALGLAAAALVGAMVGHPWKVLLAVTLLYAGWQIYNSWRLHSWLREPAALPPESAGMWADVFDDIARLQKSNEIHTERLQDVISDFQSLTDAFPDATLVLDEDDNITWFNETARQTLGLRAPEDLGQPVTNLLRDPDFANWLTVQRFVTSHHEMTSPINESRRLSVSAIDYREGQRLLILRDVTDVHDLERLRRDFVANVSHELRTPLTVLIGYLESIRGEGGEDIDGAIDRMQSQARQMQAMLDDLLELSRLQNQAGVLEEQVVDVPAMLRQLAEQAEELSAGRHELKFEIDDHLRLRGVSSDLESAFRNLIVNAIHYTPRGGRVEVSWRDSLHGPVFEVRDTGIGIPRRDLPRITERFYRVGSDRSRETGGTGLGLAIVKHVLNAHQARLLIDSTLGEGSRFECRFTEQARCWMPESPDVVTTGTGPAEEPRSASDG